MATLTLLVDFTIPTAADFMANFDALNDEVRPVTTGGTGLSSYTTGDVPYASAVTTLSKLAVGTRGQALTVNATPLPSWASLAPPGYYSRLAGAFASSATVTYTADVLELVNDTGQPIYLSGISVTPNITASGANGLDTGVEANSTWYFVWVIWNGTTTAGLLSLSSTLAGLTLPGGYTFARLVGAVFNASTGDFRDFRQRGERWYFAGDNSNGYDLVFTDQTGVTSFTLVSIAERVPGDRVTRTHGIMGGSVAGAATGMAVAATSSGEYASIALGDSTGVTEMMNWAQASQFEVPVLTAQSLWWRTPGTGAVYRLAISGFELEL